MFLGLLPQALLTTRHTGKDVSKSICQCLSIRVSANGQAHMHAMCMLDLRLFIAGVIPVILPTMLVATAVTRLRPADHTAWRRGHGGFRLVHTGITLQLLRPEYSAQHRQREVKAALSPKVEKSM